MALPILMCVTVIFVMPAGQAEWHLRDLTHLESNELLQVPAYFIECY